MKLFFGNGVKITLLAGAVAFGTVSQAAVLFYNSSSPTNNVATRATWLAAIGIGSPDLIEDFESIALDTNISGLTGLLAGGIVVTDTTSDGEAFVRGDSSYFGNSNPVGTRAVAHNEGAYLEIDFGAGVDYVGGIDIDHTGTAMIVTYVGGATSNHSLESTSGSGDSGEFWAFYRNDMPRITRIQLNSSGDGEWGIDNLEFSNPVPEPASLAALGVGILAVLRRRRR